MAPRTAPLRDPLPAGIRPRGRRVRKVANLATGATQPIADILKVSRTLVRQALNQLSRDRLVTLEPARGVSVAQPSVEVARQVFEVRKMIEASLVRQLCAVVTPAQVAQLRAHLQAEAQAVARSDVPGRM